jgi:hypothetical protein
MIEQSVPKRRHIKFRHRGITQKKTYNIRNTEKVGNLGNLYDIHHYTQGLSRPVMGLLYRSYVKHNPIVEPTRYTCYHKLFILVKHSTCFGRSFRPSSGVQNCVYSNGLCQTAADTCCYRRWDRTQFRLIPEQVTSMTYTIACVQWKTPDDGQRNCPKHVGFHSKNKFEKLVHLVGFIARNVTQCTVTWKSNLKNLLFLGLYNFKIYISEPECMGYIKSLYWYRSPILFFLSLFFWIPPSKSLSQLLLASPKSVK